MPKQSTVLGLLHFPTQNLNFLENKFISTKKDRIQEEVEAKNLGSSILTPISGICVSNKETENNKVYSIFGVLTELIKNNGPF